MRSAIEVLDAFENIRRAQRAGVYAPHKPLLILLALAGLFVVFPKALAYPVGVILVWFALAMIYRSFRLRRPPR